MTYSYKPKGTCSTNMTFTVENGIIEDVVVENGCSGNLKGLRALLMGMRVEDAISKLDGIRCGYKNTSCPDQIAQGLKLYLEN
ncbi:MAG: TIGR03905 family TSCPD domain-containing protein [Erysipelotrichales bacterium]|nr:TIGR03905 family TSCPD domain-containing protein [Erysipelotrichales bacterium]